MFDVIDVVIEAAVSIEPSTGINVVERKRDDAADRRERVDSAAHVLPSPLEARNEYQGIHQFLSVLPVFNVC